MHMRSPSRVWIGGLVIAAAIVAIAAFARWHDSGSAAAHPLVWSDCGDDFDCARLDVPIDYDHPSGKTISLALTRLAAADPAQRVGSLLLNPGGPGASGIDFARSAQRAFPDAVRSKFDIIGFDPRGVGQSAPVVCDSPTAAPTAEASATPDQHTPGARYLDSLKTYAESCQRSTGDLLAFVDTVSSARDIERIRIALGEESISYFGYSYGTFLGATYADLYPSRVRAFVLDGAIDPSLDYEAFRETQALASETVLTAFLADCARRADCPYHNDGNPQQHFEKLRATLDETPLLVTSPSGLKRRIDGYFMLAATGRGLSLRAPWQTLSLALRDAEFRHDGTGLAGLLSGGDPGSRTRRNFANAETAINCLDTQLPAIDEMDRFVAELETKAPHFADWVVGGAVYCISWPFAAKGVPHELHAEGAAPILVVGTKGDPATPYVWAQSLARQLTSSRLLTWTGYGHTASFHNPSNGTCIDAAVAAYLVDLTLPDEGKSCD